MCGFRWGGVTRIFTRRHCPKTWGTDLDTHQERQVNKKLKGRSRGRGGSILFSKSDAPGINRGAKVEGLREAQRVRKTRRGDPLKEIKLEKRGMKTARNEVGRTNTGLSLWDSGVDICGEQKKRSKTRGEKKEKVVPPGLGREDKTQRICWIHILS